MPQLGSALIKKPLACLEGWLPWRALRNHALSAQRGDVRHQALWEEVARAQTHVSSKGGLILFAALQHLARRPVCSHQTHRRRGWRKEGMKEAWGGKSEGQGL